MSPGAADVAARSRRVTASFGSDLASGHPWIVALRPRQWSKNLLVFAGIIFAAQIGDAALWIEAVGAFVAYSAASSASYLVNDVRDAAEDRRHPTKRARPVASGRLAPRRALAMASALAVLALVLGAVLGALSFVLLLGFLALQSAYTLALKHLVLIDVMAIATLFVLRAAAGAEAVDVRISPWLLLCTALLALFLGLAKRRGELVLVKGAQSPGRPVLDGYSLELVDQLVAVVAAATLISYSIYTFTVHAQAMMLTIPFVFYGVFRYLFLIHAQGLGEEPEQVLLSDAPILVCVGLWATSCALVLLLT